MATSQPVTNAGTAAFYPKAGYSPLRTTSFFNAPTASINRPFFLEPTTQLLQAVGRQQSDILIGLSAPSANWGGCSVYVSLDGESYGPVGTFVGRSTMGATTTDISPGGTAVTVDLSESLGTLQSTSAVNAASGTTLCAMRSPSGALEFFSFTTATLVSGYQWTLSGLYRGLAGTSGHVDMPIGSAFLYLGNQQFFSCALPTTFLGRQLSFEFVSFNTTGLGTQAIADTTAYSYIPSGSFIPPGLVMVGWPVAIEHL